MTMKKAQPGEKFEVKGKQYETITVRMVIDGYNAPVTSGNFVDLVARGFYNNKVGVGAGLVWPVCWGWMGGWVDM